MHKTPSQIARSLRAFQKAQKLGLLRSVRIAAGPNACKAAQSQRGIEYLGGTVPSLPLAGCRRCTANANISRSAVICCDDLTSTNSRHLEKGIDLHCHS